MGLFSSVKDGLKKGVDVSTSRVVRQLLQERLAPYGVLRELRLDSKVRQIRAEVELRGETETTELVVELYEVVKEGDAMFLVILEARTSREWMTRLVKDFLVGQRFVLPPKYAGMIEKLL